MDRPEWINRAKPVDAVCVEIGFLPAASFYYGPENGFTEETWRKLREPLYQPKLARYGDFLLSAELERPSTELIEHYRDLIRVAKRHGKDIGQLSHYFWLRPLLFARGKFAITFPWHDTWDKASSVLDALVVSGEGLLLHELDQGWEFHAFGDGNQLFLRQGDFDTGDEHFTIATNRAQFVDQIPKLRERIARLLHELSVAMGQDYWSRRW